MREIITAMVSDVFREGSGEIVPSKDAIKAIGKKTALLYKELLQKRLSETQESKPTI
jgi:hypothetical protein